MSRRLGIALVIASFAGALALAGCTQLVRVETGTIVTCTYGEVTTDTVHVIEVPADQAANYTVTRETTTCPLHLQAEALYAEAQAAILSSDLETAKAKLAEIVALDATFRRARTQLDAIDAGKKPVPDTGSTTPSTGATGTAGTDQGQLPVGPVANLAGYVPDTIAGYTGEPVTAEVFTLSRVYDPPANSPTDYLTIVVEQYKDAKAVAAEIAATIKPRYGFDVSTVNVAGHDTRFGTDGSRFATLAWSDGGVLIVIEASSAARKPADLKSTLTTLAGGLVK
jgi:hypothetical protein